MLEIAKALQLIDSKVINISLRNDAYRLFAERVGIDRKNLYYSMNHLISDGTFHQVMQEIDDLLQGKPLHRILGYRYFWKDKFYLSADTLEPRPDTEILIETCLKYAPEIQRPYKILDLGVGSGCILLSLLKEYPNANGVGVDISNGALNTAKENAAHLDLIQRTQWIQSDWLKSVAGVYDIIVSNPPYIPTEAIKKLSPTVQEYDPLKALNGGDDGLTAYRELAAKLYTFIHEGSLVILEIGYDQGESVPVLFARYGYIILDLVRDYGGNKRCLVLVRP